MKATLFKNIQFASIQCDARYMSVNDLFDMFKNF